MTPASVCVGRFSGLFHLLCWAADEGRPGFADALNFEVSVTPLEDWLFLKRLTASGQSGIVSFIRVLQLCRQI
jgi:hypothetical protein